MIPFFEQRDHSQLFEYVANVLDGQPSRPIEVSLEGIAHGSVHAWQERFMITVADTEAEDWPARLRASRERASRALAQVFERWRDAPGFDYERAYRRELRAIGETMIGLYVRQLRELAAAQAEGGPVDLELLLPSRATGLVLDMQALLREHGVAEGRSGSRPLRCSPPRGSTKSRSCASSACCSPRSLARLLPVNESPPGPGSSTT